MKPDTFQGLLERFTAKTVAVVGDFILDEYVIGDTKRVSREAPVVVIDYRHSVHQPGGAANAAQNVASLGGGALACGVVGDDREGSILRDIIITSGGDATFFAKDASVMTAVKTRILAGELHAQRQQVARIDRSRAVPDDASGVGMLVDRAAEIVERADAVLMSDYGLGVLSHRLAQAVIAASADKGIPVVVDSRFRLLDFAGATVATPNEVELFQAMKLGPGDDHRLGPIANELIERLDLSGLIITRGSRGMHVASADGNSEAVGIVGSRDVADVTGAGDTVAATVALSLASGASLFEAAEMATYAAAVVVMKRGTATVDRKELESIRAKYPTPHVEDSDE